MRQEQTQFATNVNRWRGRSRRLPAFMVGASTVVLLLSVWPGTALGASAYVRVNQVGYVTSTTKRAYLMATASERRSAW